MKTHVTPPIDYRDALMALAETIMQAAYKVIDSLPETEQWDLQPKIRHEAVDMLAAISEACGTLDPRDATWRLAQARGNLNALHSLIKMAHKVSATELEPAQMVDIQHAIDTIDKEIPSLPGKTKVWMEINYPTTSGDES